MIGGVKTPWKLARHGTKDTGRLRSAKHLAWIRRQPCILAHERLGDEGQVQAAHVRTGTDAGLSAKPSDCWVVPLCFTHHQIQHQIGEAELERRCKIDLKALALSFAKRSPVKEIRERANEP